MTALRYARIAVVLSPDEAALLKLVAIERRLTMSRLIKSTVMPVVRRLYKGSRARLEAQARAK